MTHKGSCHCGGIAFEVEGDPGEVLECNCSHCQRKGFLLWFVPREKLALKTPESNLSTYTFNKHAIKHQFCPTCGTQPFAFATAPDGTPTAAINVRCLEDVDLAGLKRKAFDGRAL
jgi:hypothetical protein